MSNVHADMLTSGEVRTIAAPILQKHMGKYGFSDIAVTEEEEFDGSHVFRMTADVEKKVPARVLIDALDEIHRSLRKKGEERFVFLSTQRPGAEDAEEDLE